MLMTLSTTDPNATDLGFLLHKHPDRVAEKDLGWGLARVFYPDRTAERCTVALWVDVDPVNLTRERSIRVEHYVNDRPFVASSFLSVAMARVFATAMAKNCQRRPELVDRKWNLDVRIPVVASRGGAEFVARLFEPLGYEVATRRIAADDASANRLFDVRLNARRTIGDVLRHLYVLLPVLDTEKHYWVGEDEVDKLVRKGEGWLDEHPERREIVRRYLKRRGHLLRSAARQLGPLVESAREAIEADRDEEAVEQSLPSDVQTTGRPLRLNEIRLAAVRDRVLATGARSVADLGCGEGKLLRLLHKESSVQRILGTDVSTRALSIARDRLTRGDAGLDPRIELRQTALTYVDPSLQGFDVACLVEVIEHIDEDRLPALESNVFKNAQPRTVIVTTPNADYNELYPSLPAGQFRHRDHRFEWTRKEFRQWATQVAHRNEYALAFEPIGPVDAEHGAPTQMAVFRK